MFDESRPADSLPHSTLALATALDALPSVVAVDVTTPPEDPGRSPVVEIVIEPDYNVVPAPVMRTVYDREKEWTTGVETVREQGYPVHLIAFARETDRRA